MVKQRGCQKLLAGQLTRHQIRLVSVRGYAPALDRHVVCPQRGRVAGSSATSGLTAGQRQRHRILTLRTSSHSEAVISSLR
jgi:hypothetical protein